MCFVHAKHAVITVVNDLKKLNRDGFNGGYVEVVSMVVRSFVFIWKSNLSVRMIFKSIECRFPEISNPSLVKTQNFQNLLLHISFFIGWLSESNFSNFVTQVHDKVMLLNLHDSGNL